MSWPTAIRPARTPRLGARDGAGALLVELRRVDPAHVVRLEDLRIEHGPMLGERRRRVWPPSRGASGFHLHVGAGVAVLAARRFGVPTMSPSLPPRSTTAGLRLVPKPRASGRRREWWSKFIVDRDPPAGSHGSRSASGARSRSWEADGRACLRRSTGSSTVFRSRRSRRRGCRGCLRAVAGRQDLSARGLARSARCSPRTGPRARATGGAARWTVASWSPDGSTVAFTRCGAPRLTRTGASRTMSDLHRQVAPGPCPRSPPKDRASSRSHRTSSASRS